MTDRHALPERDEPIDGDPPVMVPGARDPDDWTEVAATVEATIRLLDRDYVTLYWLKSSPFGPGFSPAAVDEAIRRGSIAVEVKSDLNPMGVRVARTPRCTYGGDCLLHPDVQALHNFKPAAYDALVAVLAAVRVKGTIDEADVRRIVTALGVTQPP